MMKSNIELYEALKSHVGSEGARLIAETLPPKGIPLWIGVYGTLAAVVVALVLGA